MAKADDYKEAQKERAARERGRSIPHYTGKVAKELSTPPKRGRSTPPKKSTSRSAR